MSGAYVTGEQATWGGALWTIRVYQDGGEYYAVIYDRDDERSDEYQLWIAPYRSVHPTAVAALVEAENAIVRAMEEDD